MKKLILTLMLGAAVACSGIKGEHQTVEVVNAIRTDPNNVTAERAIVPIMELNIRGLIGGTRDGQWFSSKDTAGELKGGDGYKIFTVDDSASGDLTGEKPVAEPPCEDFYGVRTRLEVETNGVALGAGAGWNAMPRNIKKLSPDSDIYKQSVADVLADKGMKDAAVKISAIYQIDLDGDGVHEVLIEAESTKQGLRSRATADDYSFVVLRTVEGDKAVNHILGGTFANNPNDLDVPASYRISSIADLNGDGKMEVVLFAQYYEGAWVEVHELVDNRTAEIKELLTTCGL